MQEPRRREGSSCKVFRGWAQVSLGPGLAQRPSGAGGRDTGGRPERLNSMDRARPAADHRGAWAGCPDVDR